MDVIKVWTDGSCLGNGTSNAKSAIGIYYGDSDSRNYSSPLTCVRHTNNRAELIAVMYAIVIDFNKHPLMIHTDSEYSVRCITSYSKKWIQNGWVTAKGTGVESVDVIQFILEAISVRTTLGLTTELVHVKGHSTDAGNNAADLLARSGAARTIEGGKLMILRKCGVPV